MIDLKRGTPCTHFARLETKTIDRWENRTAGLGTAAELSNVPVFDCRFTFKTKIAKLWAPAWPKPLLATN